MVYSERLRDATTLDNLFERFNMERPNDFTGHSMSVSDVIIMNRGGRLTAYYVDSFGFTEAALNGMNRAEVEYDVLAHTRAVLEEMGLENEVTLIGARVYGSRNRDDLYREDSDLDVVLSYRGNVRELGSGIKSADCPLWRTAY